MFDYRLGPRHLYAAPGGAPLFTNNETNAERSTAVARARPARHEGRVPPPRRQRRATCVNPDGVGTKAASTTTANVPAQRIGGVAPAADAGGADGSARRRRGDRRAHAARGGRRVLRRDPSAEGDRRRAAGAAAGAGRHAVDEADLPVRRHAVAGRRQPDMPPPRVATAHPQRALAASELDAHPVDAGQVGVPVVRGVGPGVPLRRDRAGRSGVREGEPVGAAVRAVPAPQRADPGLRVGVLRPQPAGARLGVLARLQLEKERTGQRRHRVPGEVLPEAADQLRVVGEQGRQPGDERVRGRVPRARQHHRRRSQREAARRRDPRAVGRDRLDGVLLPAHDADRDRAGARTTRSTRRWRRSSSSTSSTSAAR